MYIKSKQNKKEQKTKNGVPAVPRSAVYFSEVFVPLQGASPQQSRPVKMQPPHLAVPQVLRLGLG